MIDELQPPSQQLRETKSPQRQKQYSRYLQLSLTDVKEKGKYIEAARELPQKSYSLAPDMATGWKPKKNHKITYQNVFPINFESHTTDQIAKSLSKKNTKYNIAYLGPRKANSYCLHQNRDYDNPYPLEKKIEPMMPERPGINRNIKLGASLLTFDSDFESGNLDMAVQVASDEYDLFMRVDSNTKGHTNWYYFSIRNNSHVGAIKFNIRNFRRQRSLYQRGMKPYVRGSRDNEWAQKGYNLEYRRRSTQYSYVEQQEVESMNKSQG